MSTVASPPSAVPARRRSVVRRVLAVLGGLVLLLVLLALFAVWRYGPMRGIYLVKPSPAQYADDALRLMDNGLYAHGDAWTTARAKAVADTRGAADYAATLPALRAAVAVAGGKHSHLFDSGKSLDSTSSDRPLPTATTKDGITTLVVPKEFASDPGFKQQFADTLAGAVKAAAPATTCGWVVDVRHNHGGDMNPMLAGLSPLLQDGRLFGARYADGTTTWVELAGGSVKQGGDESLHVATQPKSDRPVAVLQGPDDGSAGENVVLAFRGQANARSFGGPTAGYSSSNSVHRLYDGTELELTVADDVDRTGRATNNSPIPPEQAVDVEQAPAAAAAWLHSRCTR